MNSDANLPRRVASTVDAYRSYWERINPPFTCHFVGTNTDIAVLDFIVYEMGSDFPTGGVGAGLLLGNVFVQEGGFKWIADANGGLFVGRNEYPRVRLDPVSRTMEQLESSVPQFDKFSRIALEMLVAG